MSVSVLVAGYGSGVDRIADGWGARTPHGRGASWPARVDQRLAEGVGESDVDRWVQSACVLCSNGCGCDIAVKDGRIVGVRGRAEDVVNRGRLGPKGLYGSWQAHGEDRLTTPLIRRGGKLVETDWDTRAVLGATLMITQSFLYNAIFFTYTLVLGKFYGVPSEVTPLYLIAFAVGNVVGPFTIGHLFDTVGRRRMLFLTYAVSGALLGVTAVLFYAGVLNAITQTIAWCVIFFFASAGASAAYLTVSDIFPLEVRAKAIGVFFAIARCFGALGPVIYGALIGTGDQPVRLFIGYLVGAVVMVAGGLVARFLAVDAENKSLEDVAIPLSATARRSHTRAEGAGSPFKT